MINTVTGWFKIAQYNDKSAIYIVNLVETMWLSRYPSAVWTRSPDLTDLGIKGSK